MNLRNKLLKVTKPSGYDLPLDIFLGQKVEINVDSSNLICKFSVNQGEVDFLTHPSRWRYAFTDSQGETWRKLKYNLRITRFQSLNTKEFSVDSSLNYICKKKNVRPTGLDIAGSGRYEMSDYGTANLWRKFDTPTYVPDARTGYVYEKSPLFQVLCDLGERDIKLLFPCKVVIKNLSEELDSADVEVYSWAPEAGQLIAHLSQLRII